MTRKFFQNGRSATIFFLALSNLSVDAQQLTITQDVMINRGLLDESFWRSQSIQATTHRVLAYTDVGVRAEWPVMGHALIYERKTINTLLSNSNTLTLVSKDGAYSSMMGNGGLDLQAQTKRYKFDALGVKFSGAALNESLLWGVTPKWVRMLNMREANGDGIFAKDDTSLSLQGNLQRMGLIPYGFQADSIEPKLMNGASIDVELAWESGPWKFNGNAQQAYSKLPAQALYFSNRTYSVNASASQGILYSTVPSLSGSYGQRDMQLSLPKIVKTDLAYKTGVLGMWVKTGLIGVDGHTVSWFGLMFNAGGHELELRTYELNNTQITYRTPAAFRGHLSGELMMIRDASGSQKAVVSGLRISF